MRRFFDTFNFGNLITIMAGVISFWVMASDFKSELRTTLADHGRRLEYLETERKRDNTETSLMARELAEIKNDTRWIRGILEGHLKNVSILLSKNDGHKNEVLK